MIMELGIIIMGEVIVLLAILTIYLADYTNSYIHCHCRTEPYPAREQSSSFKIELTENESEELIKELFGDEEDD